MNTAGQALDSAVAAIERAIRERNYAAAEYEARSLAAPVAAGELRADRIRDRLMAAMERANVARWRAGLLADWILAHVADPKSTARRPPEQRPIPEINVTPSELYRALDEAEAAVLERAMLFERAGGVVHVAASRDRPEMQVVDVTAEHLMELFDTSARFMRRNPKCDPTKPSSAEWIASRCPPDFGKTYLARRGIGWNLPTLAGVITAPTLRPDASVLDMPGYDSRTGLFLDAAGVSFPVIANRPSKADADSAAATLLDLLAEFPFVADEDRAVAFAAILTAVARRALPAAPLFAFTAPTPGTGKSYLVDVVSMIATGRPAAGLGYSADAAENRKTIESALVAGAAQIVFDNVSCEVAGDRLNQILTQPEITLRILGQTRNVSVPCGAMVMANGNALTIAADMTRRTMLCRLDANTERPELRLFDADPVGDVRADRGKYLAAALTILRAYHVAGRPERPAALASFESWSDWVRGAVTWCGLPDPAASLDHVRANDPRRSEHLAVLEAWNTALGNHRASARTIIEKASTGGDFREALLTVAGASGVVNSSRLGKWLRSHKGKLAGGMKIDTSGMVGGVAMWQLHGGTGSAETGNAADLAALIA